MKLRKEVEDILFNNLMPITYLDDLMDFKPTDDEIINYINKIFIQMVYFKPRVFNKAEIDIAWAMLHNDIWLLNDLLNKLNSQALVLVVYEIIENIFEELFVLLEDFEMFELASNILKIKNKWFSLDVKNIVKQSAEK